MKVKRLRAPEQQDKKDESEKAPPQLTVLSSGDVVPFELQIERDGAPALWRMTSQADGDLLTLRPWIDIIPWTARRRWRALWPANSTIT